VITVTAAFAVDLTVWHAWRGEERAALEQLAARWGERRPGSTVSPVFVPYENLANKLAAAIPRGNGPDLFVFAHERIAEWVDLDLLVPVEPGSAFLPVATDALRWDGRTWGWPLSYKCVALFYNRALLADPPRTTDEMVAAARRLTGDGRYGLAVELSSAYHAAPWLHGFGGGVFRDGHVALDQPANVAALRFLGTLAAVAPSETSGALVTQLFNEGRAAMAINGPWFLGELASTVDAGVAPLPVVSETGEHARPYATIEALFLARDSAEARDFGAFVAGDEGARIRRDVGRQATAALAVPPDDARLEAFRAQLDHAVPMPVAPEMVRTWEPLQRALRGLNRAALSPEAAAKQAQRDYEIVSRPAPAPASPWPWAAGLTAAAAWGVWKAWPRGFRPWRFVIPWLAPAVGAILLLVVAPFVVGAGVSLFEFDGTHLSFVGAAHFRDILLARDFPLADPLSFWRTLAVTVAWTVANVTLHATIGVALAMLLREPWVRLRGAWRALLVLPWAIPSYITALVWKGMFHRQFGAINALLVALGGEPVSWFSRFSTAFAANLATNTWLGFPFMMVVTLGALQAIPRDLEQAAEVDGAGPWARFRHVTLPLLMPALLPAIVLGSVWTFNMFNVIYLVSGGEPDGSTDVLISQAYRWAFTRGHRYGYAAAYAVIIFGVLVAYGRAANRIAGRRVI
jgi:arabinogalactan oligomer/maltooligosaccharide transport system permease protein